MSSRMTEAANGFEPYEALITGLLSEERDRKTSIEQRGLAVVTSSGTLVTLLFALAALVTEAEGIRLPETSRRLLVAAVVLFVAAGILGIFTNKPLRYAEPGTDWLRKLTVPKVWDYTTAPLAARRAAEARVASIESFRDKNKEKVRLLTAAITAQVIAVSALAVAVMVVFSESI